MKRNLEVKLNSAKTDFGGKKLSKKTEEDFGDSLSKPGRAIVLCLAHHEEAVRPCLGVFLTIVAPRGG